MKRSALVGAGTGALGAATAVAALLIGSATGYAASTPSEAYGAFITSVIDPPQPYVQWTDGATQEANLAELPENPLLALELAEVSAGDSVASVQLANVDVVPGAEAPPELDPLIEQLEELCANLPEDQSPIPPPEGLPDDLQELCLLIADPPEMDALVSIDALKVACEGDTGTVEILGLTLLGQEIDIPVNPPPNSGEQIPENPLLSLTLNKQTSTDDGFTVQGVAINIGGEFDIVLASATCGKPVEDEPDKPTATKPAPVTTGLPVTG